ncbi:MAG TPA: NAD(P)-dependent oxidoreductase [Aquella sp.]|nr:NAD(P)-dependent oxidoreductase [Aquella sp.]
MHIVLLDTNKISKHMAEMVEVLFSQYGEYKSYESTTIDNIVEHAYAAEVILVNKAEFGAEHFKLLPNLKYIIVIATGYDNVDIKTAASLNIPVSNIPDYCSEIVAQHAIALLLELTNHVGKVSTLVMREHKWRGVAQTLIELSGLTFGVVGFGSIARRVVKIAMALGMNVLVYSRKTNYITDLPVKFVTKDELFQKSDVISLHCPCVEETKYIINSNTLAIMKPTAYLINASRGGLVDEAALFNALSNRQIAGAGLDVLEIEPAKPENPLFKLDNCIITPHNAWLSDKSLQRWIDIMQDNMVAYMKGQPINLV